MAAAAGARRAASAPLGGWRLNSTQLPLRDSKHHMRTLWRCRSAGDRDASSVHFRRMVPCMCRGRQTSGQIIRLGNTV